MSPIPSPISQGLANPSTSRSLDSPCHPGRRSDAWVKIKRQGTVQCAIVGFEPEGARNFKAFVLASEVAVRLAYAGKVGTGFDAALRQQIPVVPVVDVPCKTCRRMQRSRRVA